MAGDSAGGNLIVSLSLKLIELNAKRLPDALVPIYTPFLFQVDLQFLYFSQLSVQYLPAPSRVLSFADPLLHMGVVIRCAAGTILITNNYFICLAYTNACPNGTEAEMSRRDIESFVEYKSLAQYIDDVKAKHLVEANDCNVTFFIEKLLLSLFQVEDKTNLPIGNLSIEETIAGEKREVQQAIQESKTLTEEQSKNDDGATVQIAHDVSHISLSACHYNPKLFEYLKSHPLTMR